MTTRRRILITGAYASALAWTDYASAQGKPPVVIGWLASRSRQAGSTDLILLKEGLADHGWKGSQIVIEERWADGHYERLEQFAREIGGNKPALIVTQGGQATAAVAKSLPGMPIVMAGGSDPVASGFAASLARPGGMITGTTNVSTDITGKLFEFLREAAPQRKRVAFQVNSTNVNYTAFLQAARRASARQSIDARFADVLQPGDIESAMAKLGAEGAQALIVMQSSLFVTERRRIAALALARRWPVISSQQEFADADALLTYGHDRPAGIRRAAFYVDRILKGARPGDLPIEQPTKFEMTVNLKIAKTLGITIPPTVMVRATRVIE